MTSEHFEFPTFILSSADILPDADSNFINLSLAVGSISEGKKTLF